MKVHAIGLNHLDLWVRKGVESHKFPLPIIPGSDIAGEVAHCPSGKIAKGTPVLVDPVLSCGKCFKCKSGMAPTCKQFGLMGETQDGGCAEQVTVPEENVILIPEVSDRFSIEDWASLPIAYITAWSMIRRKTNLKTGELVLIQAGGSGVSVAAIQIAKQIGAQVITTVGSDEKATRVKELGADFVINYQTSNFRQELKKILKQLDRKGVDVAIDHVGKDTFADSLRALDWGGRLAFCGATSGSEVTINLKPLFFKNISVFGTTMGGRSDLPEIVDWVSSGRLKPVIAKTFGFGDLPAAHQMLEERRVFGKVVVKI